MLHMYFEFADKDIYIYYIRNPFTAANLLWTFFSNLLI
jgi:hypothetical protein